MNLSETDTAWLAGLFEGEGTFFISRNIVNGKVYLTPRVVVGMTDKDVIEKVCILLQNKMGHTRPYGASKLDCYKSILVGKKAIEFMRLILPYMGERRSAKIRSILKD